MVINMSVFILRYESKSESEQRIGVSSLRHLLMRVESVWGGSIKISKVDDQWEIMILDLPKSQVVAELIDPDTTSD